MISMPVGLSCTIDLYNMCIFCKSLYGDCNAILVKNVALGIQIKYLMNATLG